MQDYYPETFVLIVSGCLLALVLVGFIIAILILYKNRQHSHEQELLKTQLEIQEETFKNISQEIHDNIGQVLSVIKITLASIPLKKDDPAWEYIQDSKQMLGGVIEDISDLSKSLHPDRISKVGIGDSVKFELRKLEKTGLFKTSLHQHVSHFSLSPKNEIFLFRVIQEILNNIVKHSSAKNISIVMEPAPGAVKIDIEDDGVGFDTEKALEKHPEKGIGLTSMINRTKIIGGSIDIQSRPGEGTKVSIRLPTEILTKESLNLYPNVAQ